jgi:hypothetical protein
MSMGAVGEVLPVSQLLSVVMETPRMVAAF